MPKAAKLDYTRQSSHTNGHRVISLGGRVRITLAEVARWQAPGFTFPFHLRPKQRVQAARNFVRSHLRRESHRLRRNDWLWPSQFGQDTISRNSPICSVISSVAMPAA